MSDSSDLVVRVRQEIERRRAWAIECEKVYPSPWEVTDRGWMAKVAADEPHFRTVVELNQDDVPQGTVEWLSDALFLFGSFDPASVLRLCDALESLLDRSTPPVVINALARGLGVEVEETTE